MLLLFLFCHKNCDRLTDRREGERFGGAYLFNTRKYFKDNGAQLDSHQLYCGKFWSMTTLLDPKMTRKVFAGGSFF